MKKTNKLIFIGGLLISYTMVVLIVYPTINSLVPLPENIFMLLLGTTPFSFIGGLIVYTIGKRQVVAENKQSILRATYQFMVDDGWTFLAEEEVPLQSRKNPAHAELYGHPTQSQAVSFASKTIDGILLLLMIYESYSTNERLSRNLIPVVVVPLPKKIEGWFSLWPRVFFENGIQLESVEVNRKVTVRSQPKQLAYEFFPPDMMAWYVDHSNRFPLHVEDQRMCVYTVDEPTDDIPKLRLQIDRACSDGVYMAKHIFDILTNEA